MNWLEKMKIRLQHFMRGRYGADQLTFALLVVAMILSLGSALLNSSVGSFLASAVLILCYFRILSKNTYARQQENFKFLRFYTPLKQKCLKAIKRVKAMKTHKYFKCPECNQTLRIPRGKGNVCVTCPKCKHQLHKKS